MSTPPSLPLPYSSRLARCNFCGECFPGRNGEAVRLQVRESIYASKPINLFHCARQAELEAAFDDQDLSAGVHAAGPGGGLPWGRNLSPRVSSLSLACRLSLEQKMSDMYRFHVIRFGFVNDHA